MKKRLRQKAEGAAVFVILGTKKTFADEEAIETGKQFSGGCRSKILRRHSLMKKRLRPAASVSLQWALIR